MEIRYNYKVFEWKVGNFILLFSFFFFRRGSGLARYGGVGAPKNLATPKLRRSTSNVSRKQNNDNAGDKQTRLIKTSTSAPNVGNIPTKKPMTRKTTLKLKPKSKTDSKSKSSQVNMNFKFIRF